jgi:hypothetical protein
VAIVTVRFSKTRKVSGWPQRRKLAHTFLWECGYKRLKLGHAHIPRHLCAPAMSSRSSPARSRPPWTHSAQRACTVTYRNLCICFVALTLDRTPNARPGAATGVAGAPCRQRGGAGAHSRARRRCRRASAVSTLWPRFTHAFSSFTAVYLVPGGGADAGGPEETPRPSAGCTTLAPIIG